MIHPRSPPRIHHCSQIPFAYALLVVNSAAPMLHIIMIQFFQANLEICIFCKVSGPGCCSAIELDWRGAARRGVVHRPACLSQTQATPNYLPWKQLNIHKVSGVPKYNNSIWHLQRFIKISITLKIAPTTHNWNNKKVYVNSLTENKLGCRHEPRVALNNTNTTLLSQDQCSMYYLHRVFLQVII